MISCVVDTMENRGVATNNIPITFLQTNMEGTFRVHLDIILDEMLLNIAPETYRDKVVIEQGKKVIYAVLKQALYGSLIISLLSFRDLVGKLNYWGFQ